MDGLAADADITFILTTNRADLLERALVERPGRVDLAVEIAKPDQEGRERLFRLYAADLLAAGQLSESAVHTAAARTEGVTASFTKELIRRCVVNAALAGQAPEDADVSHALDEMLSDAEALTRTLLGGEGGYFPAPEGRGTRGLIVGPATPGSRLRPACPWSAVTRSRASAEPAAQLEDRAAVVERDADVVRGLLDLGRRVTDGHAATGPAEHLDVVAAVTEGQHVGGGDAEPRGHLGQRGGLVHPVRGDVQPGAPADEVGHPVQAQMPGQRDEVLVGPGRVAQDDAGHRPGAQLLDVLDDHLARSGRRRGSGC